MNLICDTLIFLLIIICALIGKKRGFIKTFFGFFGSLIAFIFSSIAAKPIGEFFSEKLFFPALKKYFLESLSQKASLATESVDLSALPEPCLDFLQRFGFSENDLSEFLSNQAASGSLALENLADTVIKPIADSVGHAVALIVLFVLSAVAIRILVKILDLVSKLPFLNFSNQTLGLVAGILWGLLLSVILSSLLVALEPAIRGSENAFLASFDSAQTYLVQFFSSLHLLFF